MTKGEFGSINPDDIPHSASGRIPKWVTDEAQGHVVTPEPWRAPTSGQLISIQHFKRVRRIKRLIPVLVLILIFGGSRWMSTRTSFSPQAQNPANTAPLLPSKANTQPVLPASNGPTPTSEESSQPLGVPAPLVVFSPSYRFIRFQSDNKTPVAYDPCRPIHFVIGAQGQPIGGKQIIMDAVLRVSQATGLKFVFDGTTSESPSFNRAEYQPERYGDHWAPVLISWATVADNPDFAINVEGESGSISISQGSGPKIYITGLVELDSVKLSQMLQSPGGNLAVESVVLHELGHLVGLAHVADASQLMYPASGLGITDFAAGDLTGLAMLGQGACVPSL